MTPALVLVGPSGSGKSTVGRIVAELLGVPHRDTDADVEAGAQQSVGDIFVEHGEQRFRELERAAVTAALTEHEGVLSLGGGAVMDKGTRTRLRGGPVVFLDVGIADAARRVGLNRDRPLLIGNPRAQLLRLMEARRPLYEEVAAVTVQTDGKTPEQVGDEVVRALAALA